MTNELNAKEYHSYREKREASDPYFPEGTVHEDVFTVLKNRLFVWDKPKNEANKQTHGIDFYTAIYVFNDEDRLEDDNEIVDGELRDQLENRHRPWWKDILLTQSIPSPKRSSARSKVCCLWCL